MPAPTAPPIVLKGAFAPDASVLFRRLETEVTWDERMRARKTASFGVAYDYSQITYPAAPMMPPLAALCDALESELGFPANNALLNYYPDGEASMGFHSDSAEELAAGTGVAIISLGAPRLMVFRLKADRSVETAVALPSGSLLFMPAAMQADWLHAIPKAPGAGPRISVTFRQVIKSP